MRVSLKTLILAATVAPILLWAGFGWFQRANSNLVIANAAVEYRFDSLLGIPGHASFADTNFSDDDLKSLLPALRNHPNLATLDFSGTELSDTGISYLRDLPNVRTVDLRNTNVTSEGVDAVRARLPNVKFEH